MSCTGKLMLFYAVSGCDTVSSFLGHFLLATFEDMGNPFLEDSGDMLTLDTKIVMNKYAI